MLTQVRKDVREKIEQAAAPKSGSHLPLLRRNHHAGCKRLL